MTPDEFEDQLHAWGQVFGQGRADDEPGSLTGNSPLARIGRPDRKRARHDPAGRDGRGRRVRMALELGPAGVRLLPTGYVDPVPCTETRSFRANDHDSRQTPTVDAIQRAWLALRRVSRLQADVLRVQYQVRGLTRDERAAMVLDQGVSISPRLYKAKLAMARTWMHGMVVGASLTRTAGRVKVR